MTQEQYFQLFLEILPFILTFIVIPAVFWGIGKLPASKQAPARQEVQSAVHAVEQLAANATEKIPSDQKKAMAFNMAKLLLKSAGINLSDGVINTLIEAAVFALNQAGQAGATASAMITPLPPIGATTVKQ